MQYSTTETYANRYDLDKIDVFLEGDSSNPMFFSVEGISKPLSYGKHYFYISLLNFGGNALPKFPSFTIAKMNLPIIIHK